MFLRSSKINILGLVVILFFFNSCSKFKRVSADSKEAILKKELHNIYISKKKPQYILIENANIKIEGKETNRAKMNFYFEEGKKFFISLKLLGFEMMRFELSSDSVKYLNRLNREYYFESLQNIQKDLGSLLNYDILENIVTTGLISTKEYSFDNFFNNSKIRGDSLYYMGELGPGQSVLCQYSLGRLQLFDLAYFDYVKQIETKMIFERNDFGLNSIQGTFVSNGDVVKFNMDISEIQNKSYSKTEFRIGRNYHEIKSLF
ncbi:MAG: DUF4292 domain-containing protein [Bacteroidales bacterium]|nr:DUF4292 domain-containing protein [Bacteroidales bacterium]MCF8389673.1 DUF4292 domain-containing protein [Bacteroidales bacterium]